MEAHPRLEREGGEPDVETARRLLAAREDLDRAIGRTIVGQHAVRELMLVALLARGHALLIGVPGLAKTLLVQTLARALDCRFGRIQFTPDLMPSDITGTEVIEEDPETGRRRLRFLPGPVFTHVLLADEINRTPPKTQAALLQAMQEHEVTAGGATHPLEDPFFVLATQNPIEQEGTYPLPEAQLDRFMFALEIGYPERAEEIEIVRTTTAEPPAAVEPVVSRPELLAFQDLVRCGWSPSRSTTSDCLPSCSQVRRIPSPSLRRPRSAYPSSRLAILAPAKAVRWGTSWCTSSIGC